MSIQLSNNTVINIVLSLLSNTRILHQTALYHGFPYFIYMVLYGFSYFVYTVLSLHTCIHMDSCKAVILLSVISLKYFVYFIVNFILCCLIIIQLSLPGSHLASNNNGTVISESRGLNHMCLFSRVMCSVLTFIQLPQLCSTYNCNCMFYKV